jgi:hypothetical protein
VAGSLVNSVGQYAFVWSSPAQPVPPVFFLATTGSNVTHAITSPLNTINKYRISTRSQTSRLTNDFSVSNANNKISIERSDNYSRVIKMTHAYTSINFDTGIADSPGLATTFNTPVTNVTTTNIDSIWVDDAPLSQTIKILISGFQQKAYYNFRHLVYSQLLLPNITWTNSVDKYGNNVYTSQTISVNQGTLFSGVQLVSADFTQPTNTGNSTPASSILSLYQASISLTCTATNKYGDLIPLACYNEGTVVKRFMQITNLNTFSVIINTQTQPPSNVNVLLYFK